MRTKEHLINKNNIVWALFYLVYAIPMFFYIDGGITKEDGYIASKLTLTPQSVQIEAADDVGNKVVNETFSW